MADQSGRLRIVVIGGGIAGVSCIEEIYRLQSLGYPSHGGSGSGNGTACVDVTLVTLCAEITRPVVKQQHTRCLQELAIEQLSVADLVERFESLKIRTGHVEQVDIRRQVVYFRHGNEPLAYDKLCICTGARPHVFVPNHPRIIGIRDSESVEVLKDRLRDARRVVVVGNGGVAMELVEALKDVMVVWIVKHNHVGNTFLDGEAAAFILPQISRIRSCLDSPRTQGQALSFKPVADTTHTYMETNAQQHQLPRFPTCTTSAVGPDWFKRIDSSISDKQMAAHESANELQIEFATVVSEILDADGQSLWSSADFEGKNAGPVANTCEDEPSWRMRVNLENGQSYGCDLIVCAMGVEPNTEFLVGSLDLEHGDRGGILVDSKLNAARDPRVFAAGDCCTVADDNVRDTWFQMRLWSQARAMGTCAAQRMLNAEAEGSLSFEMFAHATRFFGYKVILLGLFNGQGLLGDKEALIRTFRVQCEHNESVADCARPDGQAELSSTSKRIKVLVRSTPGVEYLKVVIVDGLVKGAMLIGDTYLEDTFENLILNQLDVSLVGDHLLDDDIDIEDYFD